MEKQGTIKAINHAGQWEHAKGTFQVYKVTFEDGREYKFNAKGEFKKAVGDQIKYEVTNEQYNTAKLIYPKPQTSYSEGGAKSSDTQTQIVRQSQVKAAIDFHAINANIMGEPVNLDMVKNTAKQLINFIQTGN